MSSRQLADGLTVAAIHNRLLSLAEARSHETAPFILGLGTLTIRHEELRQLLGRPYHDGGVVDKRTFTG